MITDILTYTMHIAPSLAVVIVLLIWQNQRIGKMETRIQDMLESCMENVFAHLNDDHEP